jgi:DNA-3-methyladenine glycosylase
MPLPQSFYNRKTLIVAQDLLGKFLVRKIGNNNISGMITETEAYCGPNDLASHASRGRTPRTELMFGPPGHTYIYMIYGMYYCLNMVTEKKDYPAAVLIRGVKINGIDYKKTNGPGKLCKFLHIDKSLNGIDITSGEKLWIEDRGIKIKPSKILRTPRIGVDYAGKYKEKKWRYVLKSPTCLPAGRYPIPNETI